MRRTWKVFGVPSCEADGKRGESVQRQANFSGSGLSGYWYNRDGLQFDKRLSIEPSAKPLSQTVWLAVSHAVLHTLSQTLRLTFSHLWRPPAKP